MKAYILGKTLSSSLTIWAILTLAFLAVRIAPGDPALVMLGEYATKERVTELRRYLGLDQPLPVQYVQYVSNVLHGDLGRSFRTNRPVFDDLMQQYPYTLELAISSLLLSLPIGILFGVLAALKRNSWIDVGAMLAGTVWVGVPSFWFGLILLIVFSVQLDLFPVTGAGKLSDPASVIRSLVLPTVALGVRDAAVLARLSRSAMLEILNEDFVRTARAKGLCEKVVIFRHALRNALIPIVSVAGVNAVGLLGGTVVTETVFSRPGIGSLLIIAAAQRDYPLVVGAIFMFSFVVVGINLLCDLIYGMVDPRLSIR